MSIELIAKVMSRGVLVVLPTDTVYGLVARAADRAAVERIFEIKNRPADTQVAALVSGQRQADELVELGPLGRSLARAFWPGALTIVAPRRPRCELAVGDDLTIGVRCPDSTLLRRLADLVGPIAATSANRHGEPTLQTAREVAAALASVELVIDGGRLVGGASTVVSVINGTVAVLREGQISATDIDAVVPGAS